MNTPGNNNPFRPGEGRLPPRLAGRANECLVFTRALDEIQAGRDTSCIILYGPRGNGKTALLGWLEKEAVDRRIPKDAIISISAQLIPDQAALAQKLLPTSWLAKKGLKMVEAGIGTAWAKFRTQFNADHAPALTDALAARLKRGPMVLAIDEAHRLDPELGGYLLSLAQDFRREGQPLLLVLAGTPGLKDHLHSMGVTFWERGTRLALGRLSPTEAADAIRIPLEEANWNIEPEALDRMVEWSHGYPYFVQLLGKTAWDAVAGAGRTHITGKDAATTEAAFAGIRNEFNGTRYRELEEQSLLSAAAATAQAFLKAPDEWLNDAALDEAVTCGLTADGEQTDRNTILKTRGALKNLGYLWEQATDEQTAWEPGIPSLANYVLKNYQPPGSH